MDISKNIKKIVNLLFYICLISILTLSAGSSFLMLASIPILLATIGLDKGAKEFLIVTVGSFLLGLSFHSLKEMSLFYLAILLLALFQVWLIKSNISDKKQITINFILASLIFIGIYKYQMLVEGISIADMAKELKEALSGNIDYDIPDKAYELSFALYPSILSALAMIYSLFSLKIVRNYLAYKNKTVDMGNINTIRISKKEFVSLVVIAIGMYFLLNIILNVPAIYISANIFTILMVIIILNGILTYDYIAMSRTSILSRGMRCFFIIVFFYFYLFIFILLGVADIFANFRSKVRRIDAK